MATYVLTMPGFGASWHEEFYGGAIIQSPNVWIETPPDGTWSNWISESSADSDMNDMYDMILAAFASGATFVIVMGHSRGAQVGVYKLLRERRNDLIAAGVDPTKMLFISGGNPERAHLGLSVTDYSGATPIYPGDQPYGNGYGLTPDQTGPFKVLDIARQYEEWNDTPAALGVAAAEAAMDNDYHTHYGECPDLGLDGLPVNWDEWTWWEEGNITYLISPEPSFVTTTPRAPEVLHGGKPRENRIRHTQYLDSISPERRAIEAAYTNRPVPVLAKVD